MPFARISKEMKSGVWFVTPTVWNWYYVFDRHERWPILAESLNWLMEHRGMTLHAYVFMLNHIHIIFESEDAIACLRDFKRHTSRMIRNNISETEPRLLPLFDNGGGFRLWKEDNQPKWIETERFYEQKVRYIHNNPVVKGYVQRPEYWKWSSANPDSPLKTILHM